MLYQAMKQIRGDDIFARDGAIGAVDDLYFDDEQWAVRYLVVDTGTWLRGHKVLISPGSVLPVQPRADAIKVDLTRKQIEDAPGIEGAQKPHLRSSRELVGYAIRAVDGEAGEVEDLLVDDKTWEITDVVVDTRRWLPGKKVLVPPSAVEAIDLQRRQLDLRLTHAEIEQLPRAS
jgi:sporulation protein YlmC with PRC-barrel domain